MNHLTKVKLIQNLSEQELIHGVANNASWHEKYRDSAYIYVGGLHYEMNEGDIVTVFSQFGEIVDCRLIRDKETGKSKGFAYLAYEDQRSTDLAVDNLNGSSVCDRVLKVDHVHQYRIPKEYLTINDGENVDEKKLYMPTGPDGKGWGDYRIEDEEELQQLEDDENSVQERELKRNLDNNMFILDEDERWEKTFVKIIKEEEENVKIDNEKKSKKKEEKRKLKEEKKLKKELKREEKRKKREEMVREAFESYGIKNFNENKANINYNEKIIKSNKEDDN